MWFSQVPSTINLWYCRRKILSTLGKPSSSVQCIWTPPNILVRICLKGGLAHEIWRTKRASHDPKDIWRLILSWEGIDESGFSLRDRWLLLLLLLICFSCVRLCATPKMAAHQASPSLGFSRQEHWSGLAFLSPMHKSEVNQSCSTLHDPMDCSLPGSFIHGIFQARVLEWVAIAFCGKYSYAFTLVKGARLGNHWLFPSRFFNLLLKELSDNIKSVVHHNM